MLNKFIVLLLCNSLALLFYFLGKKTAPKKDNVLGFHNDFNTIAGFLCIFFTTIGVGLFTLFMIEVFILNLAYYERMVL